MQTVNNNNRSLRYGRIANTAHTTRPWRIHEITPDFRLEDVWILPTPGGANDFHLLVSKLTTGGRPEQGATFIGRLLWAIRWKLGKWFGWDRKEHGLGSRVTSLRNRLPADLLNCLVPETKNALFKPLYLLPNEYASEIANSTVHGVLHLGWVEDGSGGYCGQMAVLVKPNGPLSKVYLAFIKPFRYIFIYPALMRRFEREWKQPRIDTANNSQPDYSATG
jgi:hypothetical protein